MGAHLIITHFMIFLDLTNQTHLVKFDSGVHFTFPTQLFYNQPNRPKRKIRVRYRVQNRLKQHSCNSTHRCSSTHSRSSTPTVPIHVSILPLRTHVCSDVLITNSSSLSYAHTHEVISVACLNFLIT